MSGLIIALAFSPECEAELKQRGFKEQRALVKLVDSKRAGEREMLSAFTEPPIKHKPSQFVVTESWWGAEVD